MADFDIERFVSLSKKVDLSDIDWEEAARVGITDDEHRVLRYMSDTEMHTIIYLRDLLAGHTAADAEVCQFMACWVYEETHHGRALDQFMAAVGRAPEQDRYHQVTAKLSIREELTGVLSRLGAVLTPHFAAAHMCWGAINELTAAASYLALARHTRNAPLAKLVTKLARDERKHFSFYFHQAEKRLTGGGWFAQKLCAYTIRKFWEPVGIGVGEPGTLQLITSFLFGDPESRDEFLAVADTIRKLPGMEWFDMTTRFRESALADYAKMAPAEFERHRAADRALGAAA
jgi:hypothetical protein